MGLFSFLSKKRNKKQEHLDKIGEHLKNSFSNVKKDMLHLHQSVNNHMSHTNRKFNDIEDRMKRIELMFLTNHRQAREEIEEKITKQRVKEEPEESEDTQEDAVLNLLKSFPRAELKLFKALHELQNSLNAKHISYKSLANYIYPGKEYNSIRSTITQFILRLNTEGLVDKQRIGREAYAKITPYGGQILKNARVRNVIKEVEIND